MNLFKSMNTDFQHADEKGYLVQLVHEGWKQVNFLESKKGTRRGEHYHKESTEAFYIAYGSVDLTLKSQDTMQQQHFSKGDFFQIPPYTWHSMSFPEDCIMIALYDIPVEKSDGSKDIFEGEV